MKMLPGFLLLFLMVLSRACLLASKIDNHCQFLDLICETYRRLRINQSVISAAAERRFGSAALQGPGDGVGAAAGGAGL